MTLEDFLDRVEGAKKNGGGFSFICPSHEDREASAHVAEGESGLVLQCYAGCETQAILSAIGLEWGDLFYRPRNPLGEPEAIYEYKDETGAVLFEAVRFPGKKFRQRHHDPDNPDAKEDGYVYSLDEVRRALYRLPLLLDPARSHDPVYVCEGEKDVEALLLAGQVATCNPMGAGKWRDEYSPFLNGRHVIIVADRDEPGRKHAESVRKALKDVAASVSIVQAKVGKDASDHLEAGHSVEDFVPVKERVQRGIATPLDLYEMVMGNLQTTKDGAFAYENPWALDEPEFLPGRLYVLGAKTAGGKTSAALQVYRHLCERGIRPCYVSMEMSKTDLANRLLTHKGLTLKSLQRPWEMTDADRTRVAEAATEWRDWEGSISFETGANAEYCANLIDGGEYDFLIFDHLHQIENVAGGEEKDIAREVRALRNIALDYDIPVLALSQFKRPIAPGLLPTLYDFKGSSAIEQNATMAMALNGGPHLYNLMILKNRDGPQGQFYPLMFHGPKFSFTNPGRDDAGSNGSDQDVRGRVAEPGAPVPPPF